jgi:hypothetical protein
MLALHGREVDGQRLVIIVPIKSTVRIGGSFCKDAIDVVRWDHFAYSVHFSSHGSVS